MTTARPLGRLPKQEPAALPCALRRLPLHYHHPQGRGEGPVTAQGTEEGVRVDGRASRRADGALDLVALLAKNWARLQAGEEALPIDP